MTDLSILIPARNEMFLRKTIEDILEHSEADTEVIAVLDGQWVDPPIPDNPRVTLVRYPKPIGQRAATNRAAAIASGKYLMKVDAHCAFDQGFDRILLEDMQDDWTCVPIMRNLHAFNWVCPNGHTRYQSPSGPCAECGEPTIMDIVWIGKKSPQSTSYRFDSTLHFQYFNDFKKRPDGRGDLTETMSLQGSCFMMTRERYFDLNICDETWGSWGNQGTEVACKSWLSGGRVICNHKTWYAHMFRTQGGDFGFPYPLGGNEVESARQHSRDAFMNNTWDKQIHPLAWLVDRFNPVPGWHDNDEAMRILAENQKDWDRKHRVKRVVVEEPALKEWLAPAITLAPAGIVYYTENMLDPTIMHACQSQLERAANGLPIICVSRETTYFGNRNIVNPMERGYMSMFTNILLGLEALDTKYVFFAEHDVLYHPSHFLFRPPTDDAYWYNTNCWKVRLSDGHALYYFCRQTSQLCADRELLIQHYRKRVETTQRKFIELGGNTREYRDFIRRQGFEPGTHGRTERVDDYKCCDWQSEFPNIDIRHEANLTPSRWSQDKFRDKRNCRDWKEADEVSGWDYNQGKFSEFIARVAGENHG